MTAKIKITKINKGIYALTLAKGIVVELEQFPCGTWYTFGINRYGDRDYLQHYSTKRDAVALITEGREELVEFLTAEANRFKQA